MIALRDYQTGAVEAVIADLETHSKLGVILPTGSGKTEIFIEIADRFLKRNDNAAVLILSHLSLLTTQTKARFKFRKPNLETGILQAGQYPTANCEVVVGTMQTSRMENHTKIADLKLKRAIKLIIVDEAHYLYCKSYDDVLNRYPDAKVLGVTATPFRDRQLMTGFFEKISYSLSLKELIDKGFLVEPRLHEITAKGDTLETLAQTVAIYTKETPHQKALVFMDTIANANHCRNLFVEHGFKARAVTCDVTGDDREGIFKDFREGETEVLVNVNVLTAGFDAPNIRAIYLPFGTSSPTQYLQRIGRGLRLFPGKTHCDIFAFGATPAIKGGLYQQYHLEALTNKRTKELETVHDDLEYGDMEYDSEVYLWTKTMVDACERFNEIGLERLASRLAHKEFPPKFMRNISEMIKRIPNGCTASPTSTAPATQAQMNVLTKAGYTPEMLSAMTKGEASTLVAMELQKHTASEGNPWVLPSGKFAGKHVKDSTYFYQTYVVNNYPHSAAAKIVAAWWDQKRRDNETKHRANYVPSLSK